MWKGKKEAYCAIQQHTQYRGNWYCAVSGEQIPGKLFQCRKDVKTMKPRDKTWYMILIWIIVMFFIRYYISLATWTFNSICSSCRGTIPDTKTGKLTKKGFLAPWIAHHLKPLVSLCQGRIHKRNCANDITTQTCPYKCAAECNLPFICVWLQLPMWQSINVAFAPRTQKAEQRQKDKGTHIWTTRCRGNSPNHSWGIWTWLWETLFGSL